MLKLCSNGVHFRPHFSFHLNRLHLYSTSSQTEGSASSMVDFMVNALGFSREEAVTVWSKVNASKLKKTTEKPYLVVDFLKQRGINNTQIKKMISSMPDLLMCNVDKTLMPKFTAMEEMGFVGSDLVNIVASTPSMLSRGLSTRIAPLVSFLKPLFGSNEKLVKVLRRSYWLLSIDITTKLQPNIDLFRKYGLSNERILNLLAYNSQVFGHDTKKLEEFIIKVEKELGISPNSASFAEAVVMFASLSEKTLETKFKVYKSFGWTDLDIMTMIRKSARCLLLSETMIRERLEFFMNDLGCKPEYLANYAYVMLYSLKNRVLPRYTLLAALKERGHVPAELSIVTAVCSSQSDFIKKFVLPFEGELPELCKAYTCRIKGTSAN